MTHLNRVAFIGNALPRRCGIATFTTDLCRAVAESYPGLETCMVAMTDAGHSYDYPAQVTFQVNDDKIEDYVRAADFLNAGSFDFVCLQHEFGIFGGEAGGHILALISRLTMPVVTTLHTVLAKPTAAQREVFGRIVDISSKVIVMAEKGRDLLISAYNVPAKKIEVIPHGIPDVAFVGPEHAKARLGFAGRPVVLTFGLLSPNKGIEFMIDAMPSILKSQPDAVYVVLGATHPNLVKQQGEAYRNDLIARAKALGIEEHVVFLNQFVDLTTLLGFIAMCDVYVTPYLNEAQMTSGTLAYSFGLGKAVVSTPYWHARELLGDGRGVLVPFADSAAIATEVADLLNNDARRQVMCEQAYAESRTMTWACTAERYLRVFESSGVGHRLRVINGPGQSMHVRNGQTLPELHFGHFANMCDDVGLFQHAIHSVPDRSHGYCVDDNARALLLSCTLNRHGDKQLPGMLAPRFAAFVQYAWNPDTGRFRNFMSFDRRWLESNGSEDSHGRTLWALGECTRNDETESRRCWATALFSAALPIVKTFSSPRAWAFTLLGLDAYCAANPRDLTAVRVRRLLADKLVSLLPDSEANAWHWFEDVLAYDNARLPQALIVTGEATMTPAYTQAGLRSLRWLMGQQISPAGLFRPVGTASFGEARKSPKPFDQQPLEAAATISACLAAWRVDSDVQWKDWAHLAFRWYLGDNDLSLPLVDTETGSCRDGLHPDRANENRGGESVVSYLLGLAEIRHLARGIAAHGKPLSIRSHGT